mmetsp:Transcript_39072/g.117450  ORF Transcript_39072/g.117450 Transcript_39072/m.117450 type:complete len:279 (+) Transcript_39072:492-1328(+)
MRPSRASCILRRVTLLKLCSFRLLGRSPSHCHLLRRRRHVCRRTGLLFQRLLIFRCGHLRFVLRHPERLELIVCHPFALGYLYGRSGSLFQCLLIFRWFHLRFVLRHPERLELIVCHPFALGYLYGRSRSLFQCLLIFRWFHLRFVLRHPERLELIVCHPFALGYLYGRSGSLFQCLLIFRWFHLRFVLRQPERLELLVRHPFGLGYNHGHLVGGGVQGVRPRCYSPICTIQPLGLVLGCLGGRATRCLIRGVISGRLLVKIHRRIGFLFLRFSLLRL